MTGKPITRGVLLAALVVLAAATGTAMGAWNGQVMASDNTPGAEDVTYTFIATVGNDLDGVQLHNDSILINFQYADIRTGEITPQDINLVAIDRRGDFEGTQFNILLTPIVDTVTSENTGRSVAIRLNASVDDTATNAGVVAADTEVLENDEVIVQIGNLTNPAAGDYPIRMDLSMKNSGGEATGMLNIQPEQTTVQNTQTTSTEAPTTTSGEDGPGFTVAIAAIALLAAALIAVRRT